MTRVLASPTLARCEASRQPSMKRAPAARPPLTPKLTIEPAPLGSRRCASAWSGCSGRLGWTIQATAGWAAQEVQHGRGVGHVALHAQGQGLDAQQEVEGVLRAEAGAEIAQPLGPCAGGEGLRAEGLGVGEAGIAGIGLGQGREPARRLPVEPPAIDHDPADGDAMPAQPLGQRMDDDVGPVVERPAQGGA